MGASLWTAKLSDTDTDGFADYAFALMHALGFRFAPRIRDFADQRPYIHGNEPRQDCRRRYRWQSKITGRKVPGRNGG